MVTCPYCQSEMVEQVEELKNINNSYCCFKCGAYKHVITTRPILSSDEPIIKRRPIFYNLALKKPAFDVLLAQLRNYLSLGTYEYNMTLETIFYELQAQQQEEDQLEKQLADDPESIDYLGED